jgi:hypothetical protein
MAEQPTPETPRYAKMLQQPAGATKLYMITVDEGWRSTVVCGDMYEWAADWLVDQLQGKPYAPETRP